ncbi:MAG TPA: Na+/H+ antiporter subunit E [Actinocrinis sp.]|nr:Na+/H+ antiporter subunit E [Actinocrinis sp.]
MSSSHPASDSGEPHKRRRTDHLPESARYFGRALGLAAWCLIVWILLTWTVTLEQYAFGIGISLAVGLALAPLGPVVPPWAVLTARRLWRTLGLLITSLGRIVSANVRLAARIWAPSRPLRSGMVIVPTSQRSLFGLTVVGLVTSVVVDNQVVDVDRRREELQYHAVVVPEGGPEQARAKINEPVERFLLTAHLNRRAGSGSGAEAEDSARSDSGARSDSSARSLDSAQPDGQKEEKAS